jgi:hydroxymethylpyrimidine/phosphomethylpyrimidine kinase
VLSIAGSDPSGGAGIQADLKTAMAFGCHGMSVLTALTAQSTLGVRGVHAVPADFVSLQLSTLFDDCRPDAVKIGMLAERAVVAAVADGLVQLCRSAEVPTVLDPVLVATSGDRLSSDAAAREMVSRLFPVATVVTPNRSEAAVLTGVDVVDAATAVAAATVLVELGARAALVKGGDVPGSSCDDVLLLRDALQPVWFHGARIPHPATHGTGCTLSTAIACGLARGLTLVDAVRRAKAFVEAGLRAAVPVGRGAVPVDHIAAGEMLR